MKTNKIVKRLSLTITLLWVTTILFSGFTSTLSGKKYVSETAKLLTPNKALIIQKPVITEAVHQEEMRKTKIVYNNMTLDELANKLNKNLNSTLSGKGYTFAKAAIEYGVDPYLATAIALHETGCNWSCSSAVRNKNNVGGMMGHGGLLSFSSLDAGISAFIANIKKNYYNYGLTTPEAMNKKYAASTSWATKVNAYISKIKAT